MNADDLKRQWLAEENASFQGWDFSHLDGRLHTEDAPWDYRSIILEHLKPTDRLMDMGTGGGEFLLTLGHPHRLTFATEGYLPNYELCQRELAPLGIDVRRVLPDDQLPFEDAMFDMVINRHESFDMAEVARVLKPGGLFITQQVGGQNDTRLGRALDPAYVHPFAHHTLASNLEIVRDAGFAVLDAREAVLRQWYDDVGAMVYYAKIVPWTFPGFSVEGCFPALVALHRGICESGPFEDIQHRFLIVSRKP